ncbi:UvrD-helicase domain-containing protein [Flavobacterium silvaticum]|uniref:DNA 3'-5' helicase n=1 Tax=Flavobacterium silvaticum TaxID=1852020 RepID=A0A972JHZ0_9FLAO|nr:UvrD-helicase domain-containing protein [Flavobacterium silvaticum]NMH27643.1 UvrD-helicase domain-containing protein [Flavobacterium silvaticum]
MDTKSFSIYDASAGSGKTHTLVKEYLKIVLRSQKPDAYRNILAITFTNKAVHEMKTRIVDTLFEFTKDNPSGKALQMLADISFETGIPEAKLREKAKVVIRHLIHNYAAFDISTIDKFTHRVIRAFARDLNLPSTFEISLDTDNLLAEAVDSIIARAGEDPILTKLLIDFTLEKTDSDKSWDISREILDTGKLALNENHRKELLHFKDKPIEQFLEIKNRLFEAVKSLEQEASELANQALELMSANGIEQKSFYSSYIPKHFVKIASGQLIPHEGHLRYLREEDGKRYSASVHPSQKAAIDTIGNELLALLIGINSIAVKQLFYLAFLRNITPLSLLNTITSELAKIQDEQNILSISEFNAIIHNEIQGQPAPFIYERLGERYRHFFIDEFQDTSEMQWQNLVPLIDNALAGQDEYGTKGTLMIVGDPKQSIYRWRGGKAEQFIALSKTENPFSNKDKQNYSLETNWRSYSEVISFNNDFFKFLSNRFEHVDYADLYRNKSFQKSTHKTGGYVTISFLDEADEADEDPYAIATLKNIRQLQEKGFRFSEIAILTRKRQQGISLARHLNENNIPIISSETLQLEASSKVQFLLAFLKYLYNRKDVESKAKWLYRIGKLTNQKSKLPDFIAAGLAFRDDISLGKWLGQLGIGLQFDELRKKALYETVESIVSATLKETDAYVQYFLDIVLEREVQYQSGLGNFLDYWEQHGDRFSIPSPEGKDAVRIMTIHKSKGLEFPVVIFPYAEEDFSRRPSDKVWVPSNDELVGLPRLLTDVSSKMNDLGQEASEIYLQKKQEEMLDIINVLYVALTRAEEQLYVISAMNFTAKGELMQNNLSAFFIEFLTNLGLFDRSRFSYGFGDDKKISAQKPQMAEPESIRQVASALDMEDIKIARREALMWDSEQAKAIGFGNTVHEILSQINTSEDLEIVLDTAEIQGLITPLIRQQIKSIALEIVNHEDLSPFFSSGYSQYREQTIISRKGRTIKPDRIAIDASGNAYLLDYKTGAHNPKYEHQLSEYADALAEMGFSVVKKMLVYTAGPVKVIAL